ncbi:hypothetical protein [Alicyclobacillus mengziensis]|nr:hypothetical protein [Alicyclobacillus mengziensis]
MLSWLSAYKGDPFADRLCTFGAPGMGTVYTVKVRNGEGSSNH